MRKTFLSVFQSPKICHPRGGGDPGKHWVKKFFLRTENTTITKILSWKIRTKVACFKESLDPRLRGDDTMGKILKFSTFIFICCLSISTFSSLNATPRKVIITRHGDKIPGGFCLSLQGLERASAFVHYFSDLNTYQAPPITHIFAASREGKKPYIRCKQTCKPLADYLNIPMNTSYAPDQLTEVANEILTNPKYNDASVLLCWEHNHIPPLIVALGGDDPGTWDDNIFDQVYLLKYKEGKKPQVQKILQQLMYGDRATFSATPSPLPEIAVPCPKDF